MHSGTDNTKLHRYSGFKHTNNVRNTHGLDQEESTQKKITSKESNRKILNRIKE